MANKKFTISSKGVPDHDDYYIEGPLDDFLYKTTLKLQDYVEVLSGKPEYDNASYMLGAIQCSTTKREANKLIKEFKTKYVN